VPWWTYGYTPLTRPPIAEEEEIAILEEQRRLIEEELGYINRRLEELKKGETRG
jgi:hypothetical protein